MKIQILLINGIGKVEIFPSNAQFRVSLDPEFLKAYQLTADEVFQKIQLQNSPSSAGKVGAPFINDDEDYSYPVLVKDGGYIQTVEQFESLAVRTAGNEALILVKDIGKVQYISDQNISLKMLDGYPGI